MRSVEDPRQYPIIGELKDEDLLAIRPYLSVNRYSNGDIILRQTQNTADFHIVLSGTLGVYVEQNTKALVAELSTGQFFGEMSCLTGDMVSATVQANGEVITVSMPRDGLLLLVDKSTEFRNYIMKAMIERITNSNDRVLEEHTKSTVVLRQLQEERQSQYGSLVGDGPFMQQLRKKIIERSHKRDPLCIIGEKGVGKSHVAWEIHNQSKHADSPVLFMDGDTFTLAEWELKVQAAKGGMIILEGADVLAPELLQRLLDSYGETYLVMTAQRKLDLPIEQLELIPLRERQEDLPELIFTFIAEAGHSVPEVCISQEAINMLGNFPFLAGNISELKQIIQTALILSSGKIIRIDHLRFGSVREPGTRPKIGLALGSGSTRGAAHVGVIKVLEQANIPIDMIAGSSVGAFIGALYAGGQPISEFERVLPTVRWRQLVKPVVSGKGLVHNDSMVKFVEKYIGPVEFKDLSIPFAAVASDAANGEAVILNKGKVSHAISASTAIPGIIRPVQYGTRLLLDGGVAHPVPVALVKSMGADIVIAVDVSSPAPDKKLPKHFIATILNTMDIMSERMKKDELQLADVVLTPRLENNQVTFKASASYIQVGEKVTKEAIAHIHSKIQSMSLL